ncbi:MAG: tRNA pseudouridine(13) synthase TruD [Candidatus Thermoplasmatota archaeon]
MDDLIGTECYATSTEGIGGMLKSRPEDFVVEEISDLPPMGDRYTAARVRSKNWETNRLVRQMAKELRISRRRISFAGTKDKRAVTTQLMGFDATLEAVQNLRLQDVEICDLYRTNRKVQIGDLIGNRFQVIVRRLACSDEDARKRIEEIRHALSLLGGFPNFFGEQRFGTIRAVTHLIGRHIIKKDFEKAVMTYLATPIEGEEAFEARKLLEETGDMALALRTFPKHLTFELALINHLVRHPGDYAGALSVLPQNLQMMLVHAYQAYLFNRALSARMRADHPINMPLGGDMVLPVDKKGLPDAERWIPVTRDNIELLTARCREGRAFVSGVLFGWQSFTSEGVQGEIERRIIESEGLEQSDFIIPEMRRMSSKGTRRALLAQCWEFSSSVEGSVAQFRFALPKGSYATVLLREFLKPVFDKR